MNIDLIEKCNNIIPNKFELILIVNQRICEINSGSVTKIDNSGEKKNIIIALEEISEEKIDMNEIKDRLIRTYNINKKPIEMKDSYEKEDEEENIMKKLDPIEENGYDEINEEAILSSEQHNDQD